MGSLLTAYIFTMASLFLGGAICAFVFGMRVVLKITVIWMFLLTVAFFTNMLVLIAAVVSCAISIKNQPAETKLFYYVALIPILPLEWYVIPFPGINYLWDLNFIRLLALVFFLPLFLQKISGAGDNGNRIISTDIYFFGFFLLTFLMTFRLGNITYSLRELLNIMTDFVIPYYVISRYLKTAEGLHWILCGFMISAVFISFFSIFETLKMWRFFSEVLFSLGLSYDPVALIPYTRDGAVRAAGGPMFSPLGFAYFVSLAMIVCLYFWSKGLMRFLPASILISLYLIALLFTGSRGGVLIVMIGIVMIYYFKAHKSVRFIFNIAGMILMPVIVGYFLTFGFGAIDGEGTFDYRFQLILNSLDAISNNPILGSNDFLSNASLEKSYQGEGIIDVVNLYLQVVLQFGFVGLFIYLMIFLSLIKGVVKKSTVTFFDHKDLLLTLIIMTMVFIATCSNVSFIPWYILLVWSISRAYQNFEEVQWEKDELELAHSVA